MTTNTSSTITTTTDPTTGNTTYTFNSVNTNRVTVIQENPAGEVVSVSVTSATGIRSYTATLENTGSSNPQYAVQGKIINGTLTLDRSDRSASYKSADGRFDLTITLEDPSQGYATITDNNSGTSKVYESHTLTNQLKDVGHTTVEAKIITLLEKIYVYICANNSGLCE